MAIPASVTNSSNGTLPVGTTTKTIPLGFTPTSGRTLMVIASAAANQTASAGWTEYRDNLAFVEVSVFLKTSDGTETNCVLTQNGPRALAYTVWELPVGVTFSPGDVEGSADGTPMPITGAAAGNKIMLWVNSRLATSALSTGAVTWGGGATEDIDICIPATDGSTEGAHLTVGWYEGTATSAAPTLTYTANEYLVTTHQKIVLIAYVPEGGGLTFGATVATENANTGTSRATWLDGVPTNAMPAFGRSTYYLPGQTAQFSVDYNAAFTVDIYRLGHYGNTGARLLVAGVAGTPVAQPAPVVIADSNGAVTCAAWSVNASWAVPADARPGWYYALLRGGNGTSLGSVLFAVSDKNAKAPVVIVASDATWHAAYNGFGGNNVYGASTSIGNAADRALCSTYDKPVITRDNVPQTDFFNNTYPYLKWSESMGYAAGVTTIEQIKNDPTILDGRALVVWTGHNEYIPDQVMTKTKALLAAGQNMVNVAGNDFFWRVKFTDGAFGSATNGRVMWCKKDTLDGPTAIRTGGAGTPFTTEADWTGTWQDTRWALREPSSQVFGDQFIANGIRADSVVVPAAMKTLPAWRNCAGVQALTTGQSYTFTAGTLGMEWDTPAGTLEAISFSSTQVDLIGSAADANGQTYNNTSNNTTHAFQLVKNGLSYIANFNSDQWGWALDALHLRGSAAADANARQMMLNIISDLGVQPHTASVTAASLTVPTATSMTTYGFIAPPAPDLVTAIANLATRVANEFVAVRVELAGVGGTAHYLHTQISASSTWVITHNLGFTREPTIRLASAPTVPVWADVEHGDLNTTTITFPSPVTGTATF